MQDTVNRPFQGQKDVNILMLAWPIWTGDGRKGESLVILLHISTYCNVRWIMKFPAAVSKISDIFA